MTRAATWLCATVLVAAAASYVFGVVSPGTERALGFPAFDIYTYFYPNTQYALESLARGTGLLWNPYQNCGQPFFAFSITGLLYPVNLVFAVLPREPALLASMFLNLCIAGLGAWWLGREMRLSPPAALAGALAFGLGGSTLMLASWSPMHISAYAWMPAAMAAVERLLRGPSLRRAALLGVILTLQLLPGFPQISLFTYQVIALRVGWELATQRVAHRLALLALISLGLVLPPLLAAVQLLPSLEVARDSIRSLPLQPVEVGAGIGLAGLRHNLDTRPYSTGAILTAALAAVAGIGLCRGATRRMAVFYLGVGALYVLLALGEATPLFALYRRLPMGGAFRGPDRFLWVTCFALAVLAGLGVEAATRRSAARRGRALLAAATVLAAGTVLFWWLSPRGLAPADLGLLSAVAAAVVAAAWRPRLAPAAGVVVACALAVSGWLAGSSPFLNQRAGDIYGGNAVVLERVRSLLVPQERVLLDGPGGFESDYGLIPKTATLFRLPSIFDYEPQTSLRYAQYFAYMRTGRPLASVYDWYRPYGGLMPPGFNRRLFDLTATRYVIADRGVDRTPMTLGDTAPMRFEVGDIAVYENQHALPRAFFVAAMARVPEDAVLPLLAEGRVEPRQLALVGVDDGTEWSGAGSEGQGTASIVADGPQDVVIDVEADAAGFLYLADQYAPGWSAEVNGATTEILRANHAFRLVAVPGGRSRVVFHYRPRSLWIGAAVSLISGLVVVLVSLRGWLWGVRPPRGEPCSAADKRQC